MPFWRLNYPNIGDIAFNPGIVSGTNSGGTTVTISSKTTIIGFVGLGRPEFFQIHLS